MLGWLTFGMLKEGGGSQVLHIAISQKFTNTHTKYNVSKNLKSGLNYKKKIVIFLRFTLDPLL